MELKRLSARDAPGMGYVAAEDGSAMRVRADYWTDTQIRATATHYQSSLRRTGL